MGAGHRSTWVSILKGGGGLTPEGEPTGGTDFTLWTGCFARVLPNRGGEDLVARGVEVQTSITVSFEWYDVMDPKGDGSRIDEGMVLRLDDEAGWQYNIKAVHPDFQTHQTVRVEAVRVARPA